MTLGPDTAEADRTRRLREFLTDEAAPGGNQLSLAHIHPQSALLTRFTHLASLHASLSATISLLSLSEQVHALVSACRYGAGCCHAPSRWSQRSPAAAPS